MPVLARLGRSELRGEPGRGAMGNVRRGLDLFLEREVAVKTIAVNLDSYRHEERLLFYGEARSAAKLRHPAIVTIRDRGEDMSTPWMAIELLEGRDLPALIRAVGLLSHERAPGIVASGCPAISHRSRRGTQLCVSCGPPQSPAPG